MSEAQLVAEVEDAALGGSWNAAGWLLERRFPERWGKRDGRLRKSAPVPTPPTDGKLEGLAEVIELPNGGRADAASAGDQSAMMP